MSMHVTGPRDQASLCSEQVRVREHPILTWGTGSCVSGLLPLSTQSPKFRHPGLYFSTDCGIWIHMDSHSVFMVLSGHNTRVPLCHGGEGQFSNYLIISA